MPERDDRSDDRRRPAGPAWATVPTMSWTRVVPAPREEDTESGERPRGRARRPRGEEAERPVPVSPAVGHGPPVPRGTGRRPPPVPPRQILGPPGLPPRTLRPDLEEALTAPTPPGGLPAAPPPAAEEEPAAAPTDPEQILSAWQWTFDPDTLREVADDPDRLREVRDLLTGKLDARTDNAARARLLSLRAVV